MIIQRLKEFLKQQSIVPFETTLAFFFIYAAIASLAGFGVTATPLSKVLGYWITMVFNVVYLFAGLGMYFGIGLRWGNIEAFGLILLITSIVVRLIAATWILGINPMVINGYILNAAFIFSCLIRLWTIRHAQQKFR